MPVARLMLIFDPPESTHVLQTASECLNRRLSVMAVLRSSRRMTCGAAVFFLCLRLPAQQQDPHAQERIRSAVKTELAKDSDDHSRWSYKDDDRTPEHGAAVYRVVETDAGSVKKKLQQDGRALNATELAQEDARVTKFVHDAAEQEKQRKDDAQDEKRAENMLRMLPEGFLWSVKSDADNLLTLSFVPDPRFRAPSMETKVFAAMAGEVCVDKTQNRIASIQGTLINDVKFGGGLFGRLRKGGTFNVKRHEVAPQIWEITESHIHIAGKALLFKSIGEQEDEVKSGFHRVPNTTTLEQAVNLLERESPSMLASVNK
jgi:hypothetical protein